VLQELAPSAALRDWVDAFWHRPAADAGSHRVLPDGCADLLVDLSTGALSVVGTMTASMVIDGAHPELLGVRFRPGRAGALLHTELQELTDLRVEIADQRLAPRGDTLPEWIASLERELTRRASAAKADPRIDAAVARISRGGVSIDELARELSLTRQHLRRAFLAQVGVTPKTFARVMRFRRLLRSAESKRPPSWAALAVGLGYSDQSHLIAEFSEFAGTTPVPFFLSA
jgi:AraC-like DNA-binding protein